MDKLLRDIMREACPGVTVRAERYPDTRPNWHLLVSKTDTATSPPRLLSVAEALSPVVFLKGTLSEILREIGGLIEHAIRLIDEEIANPDDDEEGWYTPSDDLNMHFAE